MKKHKKMRNDEHTCKQPLEVLRTNGLSIDEDAETLPEAMKVDMEVCVEFAHALTHYILDENKQHDTNLPRLLVHFLQTDAFRKTGWKLKTPNDYVMLGFLTERILSHLEQVSNQITRDERRGVRLSSQKTALDLLELLLEDMA